MALFLAAWQAVFLVVPFNPLFISKPSLIAASLYDMVVSGDLFHDLAVSAVPFVYGFSAAVIVGVPVGIVMGWRARVGYALDPLMTVFYASPLVALAPLVIVFFGVGVSGKAIIIFLLSVFPFIFNAQAGVRAVDRLLINVVRSLGGSREGSLPQGDRAERAALHRRRRPHRHRPRPDRRPGRRVLRGLGGHRLCDRPVRRPVRARQDVRLHRGDHDDRRGDDRRHPLGGAHRVPVAGRAIDDERIPGARNRIWPRPPADDLAAPPQSLWQRFEPVILGAGSIVLLLVVWELLPRLITMSRRHQAVLHHAEPDRRHAVEDVRHRLDLAAARRQRLRASRSGLGLAIVVGLPLGVLIGRSRTLNAMFDPFITAFNATPRLVFLPLVMLWFGLGLWSKVVIVFIGALFPILINTYEGVRNSDKVLINVVRSFGAKEWDVARLVVIPNAMPYIIAGLRLAIGRAVLGVVVAEFFGSESGLGVMMVQAAGRYQVDIVFSGLIVFAVLSLVMTRAVQMLENRLSRWRPQRAGGE